MWNNLSEAKRILSVVKSLKDIAEFEKSEVHYTTESGKCMGKSIFNVGDVAVQDAYLSENCKLTAHLHEKEEEILILYKGDLTVQMQDEEGRLRDVTIYDKGSVSIPMNSSHIASSRNGCKLIAITIPASSGYPKNS